jgi:hypothetical protein
VKGVERFGSAWEQTVCTAGAALGDWRSSRHREANMLEAGDDHSHGSRDVQRQRE